MTYGERELVYLLAEEGADAVAERLTTILENRIWDLDNNEGGAPTGMYTVASQLREKYPKPRDSGEVVDKTRPP